jgi:hypothetical protein
MKYWIGAVSKDHVQKGVELGIVQIGHGKRDGLDRMKAGDGFVYYSPKASMDSLERLQTFTAIGHITDDTVWEADEGEFKPWRRNVTYLKSKDAHIRPLVEELDFTRGKPSWGYAFRYGLVEISEADFKTIAEAMKAKL